MDERRPAVAPADAHARLLLVATLDGRLHAFDQATGARLWHADVGGPMFLPVCGADGCPDVADQVLAEPAGGQLFAVDAAQASFVALPLTLAAVPAHSPVLLADGRVLVGSVVSHVLALDVRTGRKTRKGDARALVFARRQYEVSVLGAGAEMRLLFASLEGYSAGDAPSILGAHGVAGPGVAVRFAPDGRVAALDAASGAQRWTFLLPSLPVAAYVVRSVALPGGRGHATLSRADVLPPAGGAGLRIGVLHDADLRAFVLSTRHYGAVAERPGAGTSLPSRDVDFDAADPAFPFAVVDYAPTPLLAGPPADTGSGRSATATVVLFSAVFGGLVAIAALKRRYRRRSPLDVPQDAPVLGHGSNGTLVLRGRYLGRPVAVKRVLAQHVAMSENEVALLSRSDHHAHVVRMYYAERAGPFAYIALELCACTLEDVVARRVVPGAASSGVAGAAAGESSQSKTVGGRVWARIAAAYRRLFGGRTEKMELHTQDEPVVDSPVEAPCSGDQPKDEAQTATSSPPSDSLPSDAPPSDSPPPGLPLPTALRLVSQSDAQHRGLVVRLLREATEGLAHVHATGLVHRDVKPANILVTPAGRAVLGDFGISRAAEPRADATAAGPPGSAGWRAPEVLAGRSRGTPRADVFSLGVVYAWALSGGSHPYGPPGAGRDAAVLSSAPNLAALEAAAPVATDLVAAMLSAQPEDRPDAAAVVRHVLFWPPERRLSFLHDASDVIEALDRRLDASLHALETSAQTVFNGRATWDAQIDGLLWADINRRRLYDGRLVKDLVRAIRNKRAHFQELPADVRALLGPRPADLMAYFDARFPRLVLHVQRFIACSPYADDPRFAP